MRKSLILFTVLFFSYGSLFAYEFSDNYFGIAKVKVESVEVVQSLDSAGAPLLNSCDPEFQKALDSTDISDVNDIISDLGASDVSLDQIVNIGKKIWMIVSSGKPVANVNTRVAHALPAGINCWLDLESWKMPKARIVRVVYENYLGMRVVEFSYRLSFIYGGQFKGKGNYITEATVLPAELYVAWGFKFDANVDIPTVFNMGTKANPVAAMQVNIKWVIETPIAHSESTDSYVISGTGELKAL